MIRPQLRTMALKVIAGLLLIASPAVSSAQVVYHNGLPDNSGGLPITTPWSTANDFTLSQATTLQSMNWYALILGSKGPSPVSANYYWKIFKDDGGRPGVEVAGNLVAGSSGSLVSQYGCCEPLPWEYQAYSFTAYLGNTSLGAGTYWMAIGNFSATYGNTYYWANSQHGYGNESKRQEEGGWRTYPNEGAFTIYGSSETSTVPEPASIALLITGLSGVGFMRRRKKSS